MENTKYGRRREGRWTPIRAKAQDTRANPNSWETHLVRKSWDIGLLRALSPGIMMMNEVWCVGGYGSTILMPNGANASGLACKRKKNILNVFFNSIRKQKLLRNFFTKI